MVLSARSRYVYIPRFRGNRSLPEKDQVTVEIIRPRAEERDQLFSLDPEREVGLDDFQKPGTSRAVTLKTRFRVGQILRNHAGKIENLAVEENGNQRVISSGAELADCTAFGIVGLVDEIKAEVLSDVLTEYEKKTTP
jgi:hypothetical protein